MDSDQKYQIQLTEKALHQYNQLLKNEKTLERMKTEVQPQNQPASSKQSSEAVSQQIPQLLLPFMANLSSKKSIGQNFSTGLAMLKDKVIKPLLVATERVVEYYFPEEKKDDKFET